MSKTIGIFIYTTHTLHFLLEILEIRLNLYFVRQGDETEHWYEARNNEAILTLGEHDYENEGSLAFKQYPYCLDIYYRKQGTLLPEELEQKRINLAKTIFTTLKTALPSAALLLVDDLQVKIEEFPE